MRSVFEAPSDTAEIFIVAAADGNVKEIEKAVGVEVEKAVGVEVEKAVGVEVEKDVEVKVGAMDEVVVD